MDTYMSTVYGFLSTYWKLSANRQVYLGFSIARLVENFSREPKQ